MIFVDDILTYFRTLGHAAEYGTLEQLNEQLTNVDYAASTDGMVAFVRLIGEQRTVDGYDQCDIAVHLSWLCPLDFDGEMMLSTQEQAKDTLKVWINHLRGGNTVTVSEDARWQFGYDDFAENVAWVAVRVTITASAADCVPLSPEPPTPPAPVQVYDIFCPQYIMRVPFYAVLAEAQNPIYYNERYYVTIAVIEGYKTWDCLLWVGDQRPGSFGIELNDTVTNENIDAWRQRMQEMGKQMAVETEAWLRERIGRQIWSLELQNLPQGLDNMLAAYSATNYESKPVTVI